VSALAAAAAVERSRVSRTIFWCLGSGSRWPPPPAACPSAGRRAPGSPGKREVVEVVKVVEVVEVGFSHMY
jgi:hypothetical protein